MGRTAHFTDDETHSSTASIPVLAAVLDSLAGTMHDQPEPTEEEQEQADEPRQREEEAQRYPGHDEPPRADDDDG